ncbi:MAG: 30S ribosomal protein S10 [Gammaproteobacteria bacterium]
MAAEKIPQQVPKFRIRLSGFDHVLIDQSTQSIVNTVRRTGAKVCGPVPLPVRRRRYDLLRSPHKYKSSREQIEIREHCRLLDIIDLSNKATSALTNLDLPAGVHVDIKVLSV